VVAAPAVVQRRAIRRQVVLTKVHGTRIGAGAGASGSISCRAAARGHGGTPAIDN
jgi:hypothetical protein